MQWLQFCERKPEFRCRCPHQCLPGDAARYDHLFNFHTHAHVQNGKMRMALNFRAVNTFDQLEFCIVHILRA